MPGVVDTKVGYMGGTLEHPSYREVCTDRTGHAEVVQLTYDPSQVTYKAARDSKARLQASGRYERPIVTEIATASTFWPAEDYHQRYLEKMGLGSCHL